jgi:N-acetylglucosaminyldiphosphoundecaprenol N-acetyl-beta-D-mannosaminyltransferase
MSSTSPVFPPTDLQDLEAVGHRKAVSTGTSANGSKLGYLTAARTPAGVTEPLSLPTCLVDGVRLHAISESRTIETILSELELGRGGMVVTPNLDHLRRCRTEKSFQATVAEADLVVADGMPLVWASWLQGTPLPGRVAGSDLISSLSAAAAEADRSVFLLGGQPGTADATKAHFAKEHPTLRVVGTLCPPYGFEYDTKQMAAVVDTLSSANPDIIFVALGSPKQEKLIVHLRDTLPSAWWLGVGISFSFISGEVRRAPEWMRRSGGEWIHRMIQEPRRLVRRYLINGVPFACRLLSGSAVERVKRKFGLPPSAPPWTYPPARHARRAVQAEQPFDAATRQASDTNARAVEANRWIGTSPAHGPVVRQGAAAIPGNVSSNHDTAESDDVTGVLSNLKALVLLAGRTRPNAFTLGAARSPFELPIHVDEAGRHERLTDGWLAWAQSVLNVAPLESLPVRAMLSDEDDAPLAIAPAGVVPRPADFIRYHCDKAEHRGTGGALHDIAQEYGDDDVLLVCTAQQVMLDRLDAIVRLLASRLARGAAVALLDHADGTPGGPMLIRCEALRQINPTTYVDMKEQALPRIAAKHDVRVVRTRAPTSAPIRTAESYIAALTRYHAVFSGRMRGAEPHPLGKPLAEDLERHFAIVEPEAEVHPTAYLHDSVVLEGARVEANAIVVRSVVCPGGVVKRDGQVVDATVTPARP